MRTNVPAEDIRSFELFTTSYVCSTVPIMTHRGEMAVIIPLCFTTESREAH